MSARLATGCMYMYEASQSIVLYEVNQYHPIIGLSQNGCNSGVTFQTSSTGAITDTEDNGEGILRCTDSAHGLTTGQYISLVGMADANHVGLTRVTVGSASVFDCDNISYNSDGDMGTWVRGSQLIVDPGHGGVYSVQFSASMLSVGTNKNYKLEFVKNATNEDTMVVETKIAVSNDLKPLSTGGLVALTSGDAIWVVVEGTTDSTNLTIEHMNVHMARI